MMNAAPARTIKERERRKSKAVAKLQPLKRNFDRIETDCIYRVVENVLKHVKELEILKRIVCDDTFIFSIRDLNVRDLVLTHQNLLRCYKQGESKKELQMSLKNILKLLDQNQTSLSSCIKHSTEVLPADFLRVMIDLCKIAREKLLTETEEENERRRFLLQSMERARHSNKVIHSLTENLNDKVNEKEHKLNEKDHVIRVMKRELDTLLSTADKENNTTLNDAAKQIMTDHKMLERKQTKLNQEVFDLKDRLHKLRSSNYATESKLRKRKFKMEGELYNWIVKYDQDMGWRQDQIEEMTQMNKQDLAGITELEPHFVAIEKEYDAIMEERTVKKEKKLKEERETRIKANAIIRIQAMWRGHKARMKLKRKNKKNVKGKGRRKGEKK